MSVVEPHSGFSFSGLSYITFQSAVEVVIISFAGYWCTSAGLLPKSSQKSISLLNMGLFTPALIFSKLSNNLSLSKMMEVVVIPIFFLVITGVSYISGKITSKFLQLDENESNFVIANSVFGNSNSLPVSLILSLAYALPSLSWDEIPNDTRDSIAGRGILYLLIFQQMSQVLRWTWGYNTLMRWSGESSPSTSTSYYVLGEQIESRTGDDLESLASFRDEQRSHKLKLIDAVLGFTKKIRNYMNPPLYAMLLSIVVALISPIKDLFYGEDSFVKNTATSAVDRIGSLSIPLILIILGASLYPDCNAPQKIHNHKRLVLGSIIGRMVIPPCAILPAITFCSKYLKISILTDPVFILVAFILTVSPPAIQLTQITQLNDFFEGEMVAVLFWGYVVFALPVYIFAVNGAIRALQWAS